MKKFGNFILSLIIILSLSSVLSGCVSPDAPGDETDVSAKNSRVRIYDVPEGVDRYADAEIYIGGTAAPAYSVKVNPSQTWSSDEQRLVNGVCLFELDGVAQVTVKPDVQINYSSVVRPVSAKITPVANIAENTLTFTVKSAGEYILEVNGDAYNAIHFFVSDYDGEGAGKYSGYTNIITFGKGLHTASNDSRISSVNNQITLKSDTLVYLEDGAVVRGRFYAGNAENIRIAGRGIIDGSTFVRDAAKGIVTVPLEFSYCKGVALNDFTVLDPAGWCVNFYFVENSSLDDIKIITSRPNGDGVSLQSCKNVTTTGCFVRSWDDSLVVKNYPRWSDRAEGATENITFTDCTLWTDMAQSMELGYETVGVTFNNITFENITVVHAMHKAVMSIHNANNAEITGVVFRDITIEDGKNAADGVGLIDFRVLYSALYSNQHAVTGLGNVTGVTVENVNVLSARKFTATVGGCHDSRRGYEGDFFVEDVTVKNIALAGARPSQSDCKFLIAEDYVRSFEFVQDENFEVTGATFLFSRSDEYLASFNGNCTVQLI